MREYDIDALISVAQFNLSKIRKERALEKAKFQNEIQRLRAQHQRVQERIATFVSGLVKRKKQPAADLNVYREAITQVFGTAYVPAFCLAKQAFLLRAMHSMICCDESLAKLKSQCMQAIKDVEKIPRRFQEETAATSVHYMNLLIVVQRDIHTYEQDIEEKLARIQRLESIANRSGVDEDALLDDVPLEDNQYVKFGAPKRSISSDRTLDTVSVSYADGSSVDGDEGFPLEFPATSNTPPLRFVDHS